MSIPVILDTDIGFDVDDVAESFETISDFTDADHPDTVGYAMKAISQNPMLGGS